MRQPSQAVVVHNERGDCFQIADQHQSKEGKPTLYNTRFRRLPVRGKLKKSKAGRGSDHLVGAKGTTNVHGAVCLCERACEVQVVQHVTRDTVDARQTHLRPAFPAGRRPGFFFFFFWSEDITVSLMAHHWHPTPTAAERRSRSDARLRE